MDAKVDEREAEAPLRGNGAAASDIAIHLACAKALAVSGKMPGRLVIGADQVLALGTRLFTKPANLSEAATQLALLSGKTHELHSALCVARDGEILLQAVPIARLTCRTLSQDFIEAYVQAAGEALLGSVGAYQIEGLGVHLFERVEGDHATILGLPLLPLLSFLREEGSLCG
jgi:septum formation protein